jgi:hypothetical protein
MNRAGIELFVTIPSEYEDGVINLELVGNAWEAASKKARGH